MWTCWHKDRRHKKYEIGTLQVQIASPTLTNIILDKLDKFIAKYKESFESGKKRQANSEYISLRNQRSNN